MFCKWILNTELIGNQLGFQRGGRLFVSNPVAQGYLFIIAQLRAEEKPGFDVEILIPDGNKFEVAVDPFQYVANFQVRFVQNQVTVCSRTAQETH